MKRTSSHSSRGMTLIEIGVVLFLMAMLVGIGIPTLKSVSGTQARAEASKMASNLRALRGHSAVSGQTCRMIFDLDANSYAAECAKGVVQISKEIEKLEENKHSEDDSRYQSEEDKVKQEIQNRVRFAPFAALPVQTLAGDLKIYSLWVTHQESPISKGRSYIYFYPSGLSERANIQLRWGEDTWYTLQVSALAGKVKILSEKADLKDREENDDS